MKHLRINDYRQEAYRRLPRFVFDYLEGGVDREDCLARNTVDLQQLQLLPTVLRDTRSVHTSIDVYGHRWNAPLGVAPTGLNGLIRPRGDLLLARAAARAGLPFVLSTASNERLETVRAAAPNGINWLQLYVMGDRSIAEQIVRRARRENFGALILTVDVPIAGNRERDIRNGFRMPFRPSLRTVLNMVFHPGWLAGITRHGVPRFVNLTESPNTIASAEAGAALLSREMDRGLVWESLSWLRSLWDLPLLLKGILHPNDAQQAVHHGVDGLIVSNHGGRQFDAAPSAITALAPVIDAIGDKFPVFVDSGFRSGNDIVKALALGARAVFVGRPAMYGLAYDGEDGAEAVLKLLIAETVHTMTMIGASGISDINRQHLVRKLGCY